MGKPSSPPLPAAHSVFWDLYCAAPDRREACEHSNEAKAFQDYVSPCPGDWDQGSWAWAGFWACGLGVLCGLRLAWVAKWVWLWGLIWDLATSGESLFPLLSIGILTRWGRSFHCAQLLRAPTAPPHTFLRPAPPLLSII